MEVTTLFLFAIAVMCSFQSKATAESNDAMVKVLLVDYDSDGFVDGPDVWENGNLHLGGYGLGWQNKPIQIHGQGWMKYNPSKQDRETTVLKDTDGDGMPDDAEDLNQNGIFDREAYYLKTEQREVRETDLHDADTDDDGLSDAYESGYCPFDTNFLNENKKSNRTDPFDPDTDHDGLPDGLELGLRTPADGVRRWLAHVPGPPIKNTKLKALFKFKKKAKDGWVTIERPCFIPDDDPESITDPTRMDTNGDGIPDGEQDVNANGRCDRGETNPAAGFVFDDAYGNPDHIFRSPIKASWLDLIELTYQPPSHEKDIKDTLKISAPDSLSIKYIKIYPVKRYWGCVFVYSPEEEKQQDFLMYSIHEGRSIATSRPDKDLKKLVDSWEKNHLSKSLPRREFIKIFIRPKKTFNGMVEIHGESPEFLNGKTPLIKIKAQSD